MLQGSLDCTPVGNHGYVCKDKKCIETQRRKTQEYGKQLQLCEQLKEINLTHKTSTLTALVSEV